MSGFTPINLGVVWDFVDRLPRRHQQAGTVLCIYLLGRARRTPGQFEGASLERGQVVYGGKELARCCRVSHQTLRTLISCFKKAHFLTIKSTSLGSIATIIDFDSYVNDKPKTNTETNTQLTSDQQATNNIPNGKGLNGKRNDVPPTLPPDIDAGTYEDEMIATWEEIDPDDPEPPLKLFRDMRREFGADIPIRALHRFAATRGSLDSLERPDEYAGYLWSMCQSEQSEPYKPPDLTLAPAVPDPPKQTMTEYIEQLKQERLEK